MCELLAVVKKNNDTLYIKSALVRRSSGYFSYLDSQVQAIAQMYSFQTTTNKFIIDISSVWWSQVSMMRTTMSQSKYALVGDVCALDKTNSPQFWKSG
jgi:hypothetical protein